jgi:2-polyprenyl-3-methyl-5-hydroxy-6-metoxy-1,4-benzoquinol methylase
MNQATKEVTERYLTTTSSRAGAIDAAHYEMAAQQLRRRLRHWMPQRGSRVLDLGCGLGELLYLCQTSGCAQMVGVNLCREEIEAARPYAQANFQCMDILEYLRNSSATFDQIFALNILEHLDKDSLLDVLRQSGAHLAPGGTLVAMTPNAISPLGSVTRYWDITHECAFTPNNFRQLAPLAGFSSQVEFRECGPVPHGPVSFSRWMVWQGVRAAIRTYLLVEVADSKGGIYTMDMMVRLHRKESPGT